MRWFRPEVHDLPLKASRSSRWAALAITDDPEAFSLCRTCIAERPLLAAALCTDRTVIHGAGLLRTPGTRPATRAVPVAARAFGARWPFSATFAVVQDAIAIRPRHAGVSEAAALSAALRAYRSVFASAGHLRRGRARGKRAVARAVVNGDSAGREEGGGYRYPGCQFRDRKQVHVFLLVDDLRFLPIDQGSGRKLQVAA